MTSAQMERRLAALEEAVGQLKAQAARRGDPSRPWWRDDAGRFADDPIFDEIARLGRAYRESLRPGRGKSRRARP